MFWLYLNDRLVAGPYRHMQTARRLAVATADEFAAPVEVCTKDAKGSRRIRTIIQPDGSARPPEGAETGREGCTKGSGRPCFCTPCREERKSRRG